ncbi:MAG: hypothetical protein R3C99_10755 [Pirellulaceae bacterium]
MSPVGSQNMYAWGAFTGLKQDDELKAVWYRPDQTEDGFEIVTVLQDTNFASSIPKSRHDPAGYGDMDGRVSGQRREGGRADVRGRQPWPARCVHFSFWFANCR